MLYPVSGDKIAQMTETTINDNFTKPAPHKAGLGRRLFLEKSDGLTLVFSTLIINLFSLAVPLVTLQVYDRILAFHSTGTLQVLCAGIFIITILDIIMRLSRSGLIGWASARFEHAAYTNALKHLLGAQLHALGKYSHGEQLHKLGSIAKLKSFYSGQSLINLIDLPFVIVFLGFIAYLSGWLVAVPVVLLIVFGGYATYLGHSMKRALEMRDRDDDKRINFVSEILENIHTVKMLGLESTLQRRHEALQGKNIHDTHTLNTRNAQSYNASALFTQIMMISMIAIGALMTVNGQITMGVLIACVLLSGRVMQPVQRALSFWISYQEFRLAQQKIETLFAVPLQAKIEKENLKAPKGKLEIKNLVFSYEDRSHKIFDNLSLTLAPGKVISLGGPPGDGKTTLLKLIAGLQDPTAGQILIDGMETCRIPSGTLPHYVGYLPSQSDIFQGTIMDNLTSFRPEMEEQTLEIAKYLGIDKVVSKLSRGYQTQLFDSPADPVTPGMKQRITIGRVLVNRPRLLLFDFADKSLDKDGYNHVFRLLGQLKGQASMIIVSNDRNILHLAQQEYVLENGTLVTLDDSRYSKSDAVEMTLKELRS